LEKNVAFDEGTIKFYSRYPPAIDFCSSFKLYQDKHNADGSIVDAASGPAALLRNMKHLAGTNRVIYCDR